MKIIQVNKYESYKRVPVADIRKRIKDHQYQFVFSRMHSSMKDVFIFKIYNKRKNLIAEVFVKNEKGGEK